MNGGYFPLDVEEVVKETDTAFLFRFHDGEEEWIGKEEVGEPSRYALGDRGITVQLRDRVSA
jgi:hypothetical protein